MLLILGFVGKVVVVIDRRFWFFFLYLFFVYLFILFLHGYCLCIVVFFLFYCFVCDVIWVVGLYCQISAICFHYFGSAIYLVDVVVRISIRSTLVEC